MENALYIYRVDGSFHVLNATKQDLLAVVHDVAFLNTVVLGYVGEQIHKRNSFTVFFDKEIIAAEYMTAITEITE